MRALIQRVARASIDIDGQPGGQIRQGLVIFLGISDGNTEADATWLAEKILKLRLFDDTAVTSSGQKSIRDICGGMLIVSQFTLHASTRKGTKPSYHRAADPEVAEPLYDSFVAKMKAAHTGQVETGRFGAYMNVELANDGPVTILLDSQNKE